MAQGRDLCILFARSQFENSVFYELNRSRFILHIHISLTGAQWNPDLR